MLYRKNKIALFLTSLAIGSILLISCTPANFPNQNAELKGVSSPLAERPNFLLIVADDLGYSDLGIMGSEIRTPNIDALAQSGLLFTNFYSGGTCSPTRAMLMTGIDHHRAGIGTMLEHIAPNQVGQPGYEGYPNENVVTLPELLRDAGYQTYATGKWHLGMSEDRSPAARGFEKSFMLLNGGAGHFDQTGLNDRTHPAPYREDGVETDLTEEFDYSTDFYTRKMINYIENGQANGKPFFGYLAYTAPHWPLQAPDEDIAKYKGEYDAGWDATQQSRLGRMKSMGLLPETAQAHPILSLAGSWEDMSEDERAIESKKMEIYAAMVDRMDQQIGKLVTYLKETGQFDNTAIIFMSDNGAEGAPLYKIPPFRKWMNRFDNSLENMGRGNSYVYYEERWAQVGMTPFRLYKGMASEGGVHVPAFITYPGFKNQGKRHSSLTSVMDIAPTILDMANVEQANGTYKEKPVYDMQGVSWLPVLNEDREAVRSSTEGYGWELFNKKGYRRGKWKALHLHKPFGPDEWQLYDLSIDPGETRDLSSKHLEILEELIAAWEIYAKENGVVLGNTPPER